ncbi:MAG: zinc-binding dehydrogenase [Actinobacteria bacterium]|nr:zinc-binding dehydrogenase [Actinomycetota bacterium]
MAKMKALKLSSKYDPKKGYRLTEYELTTKKIWDSSSVWRYPKLDLVEVKIPEIGPRDILMKVRSCGICGSDLHIVEYDDEGYMLYPGHARLENIILGHEISGIVAEKGSEVVDFKVGDYVTTEEMTWCGECVACRNGFPNQCERLEEVGITYDGGFAEYLKVPAKLCWNINGFKNIYREEELVFDVGATIEPNSVAYNSLFERGQGIRPGQRVVIFGCGPIGLFGISQLKAAGASKVVVFEPGEGRRKLALEMGADKVFDPIIITGSGNRVEDVIFDETAGQGADLFLESSGATEINMPSMLNSLNVNGKIILVAWPPKPVPTDFKKMFPRAAQIYCSMGHSGNGSFENVIRLISAGMIHPEKIITSRYKITDGLEAMEIAKKREAAKIIIKP